LVKYNDKDYAMKQLEELRKDIQSTMSGAISNITRLQQAVDQIKCGLTCGHSWELQDFDSLTYPGRKPPGVYRYRCVRCDEVIVLQADKKKDWEPHIKIAELENGKGTV
jgi:hypothetical protein